MTAKERIEEIRDLLDTVEFKTNSLLNDEDIILDFKIETDKKEANAKASRVVQFTVKGQINQEI